MIFKHGHFKSRLDNELGSWSKKVYHHTKEFYTDKPNKKWDALYKFTFNKSIYIPSGTTIRIDAIRG